MIAAITSLRLSDIAAVVVVTLAVICLLVLVDSGDDE